MSKKTKHIGAPKTCLACGGDMELEDTKQVADKDYKARKYKCTICDYQEVMHGAEGVDRQILRKTEKQ